MIDSTHPRASTALLSAVYGAGFRGLTDLARTAGLSYRTLQAASVGDTRINDATTAKVAELLGIDADELRALLPAQRLRGNPGPNTVVPSLRSAGLTVADFCRRYGFSRAALSFATSGRRRPSEALYRALEEATGKPRELLWPEAFSGKGASS